MYKDAILKHHTHIIKYNQEIIVIKADELTNNKNKFYSIIYQHGRVSVGVCV